MNYSSQVEKDYEVRGWYGATQEVLHDGGGATAPLIKAAAGVIINL